MSNVLGKIKLNITEALNVALKKAIESGEMQLEEIPQVHLETPHEKANGDFSCTISMQLAKILKQSPRKIAEVIKKYLVTDEYIDKVEIAGAGFINFYLNNNYLYETVEVCQKEGSNFGKTNWGQNKKVMVEFISANPTGPMHMGNARGGAVGDVLAEVMSWAGYDVTREFYLNDAGNQIKKFQKSLSIRYMQQLGEDVELPEDCYQGGDITEHADAYIELYGDKLKNVSEEERQEALRDFALPKNIEKMKKDLEAYKIFYDVWFSEKSLYESNEIYDTINLLKEKGFTYEQDGTLWFKATLFGVEKDEVLVRSNGIPTYFAGDIAYHRNKFAKRGFEKVIDIWGADHHGHVARMKGAMDSVGCNGNNLEIVLMQLVRLLKGSEVVRMSKRSGKAITLSDLIEDIGVDAARFFFNMRSYSSQLDFDLDLAVKKSNENPVFYVQYAHARIHSIIKQIEEEGIVIPDAHNVKLDLLTNETEINLMKKLAELPEEIVVAASLMDPSKITRYVLDLAGLFHSFYNSCRVKVADTELMNARLVLIQSVKTVINNSLTILGVSAPEVM